MSALNESFLRRSRRVRHTLKRAANGRVRLSVFRSSKHIYAQVIDDSAGKTMAAASTLDKDLKGALAKGCDLAAAQAVGKLVAERALKARCPGLAVEYVKLDMDRDFEEQGVDREIADVVYSVNTVHIARDLNTTLARIRETLKPGGAAVFSECVRPFEGQPIYVEFVFNFLEKKNFTYVKSVSNCFMIDCKRDPAAVASAMFKEKVVVGRTWPAWPTHLRVSVGTPEEMEKFKQAFLKVMA